MSMGRLAVRAISALLPYLLVVAGRHLDVLYVAQLERYDSRRVWRWIRLNRPVVVGGLEAAVQAAVLGAALALATVPLAGLWAYGVWVAAGAWLARRRASVQVSQRVQFTPRAIRLTLLTGLLATAVLVGVALPMARAASALAPVSPASAGAIGLAGGLAAASMCAAGTVLAANLVASPLERAVNRRYVGLAAARMRRFPGRVVGVTGSYGKTTTKFVTAAVLARRYQVFKTPDGVNTTMGITRVVREDLRDHHQFFVVEVAAYGPGEIREVCEILRPGLGIVTAVGVQHLERFGTLERIAEAKYELVAALPLDAPAIFNADDPGCMQLAERARDEGRRVLLYGMGEDERSLDVRGKNIKLSARGSAFAVESRAGTATFETRLLGHWNVSNILGATAAALTCGVPLPEIREAVKSLAPAPKRLEVREEGGVVKLIDVANANPRGARMALEVLGQFEGGAKILITPGLVELGTIEAEENRRLGLAAARVCDYVVLVGPRRTLPIREGLREGGFSEGRILVARHSGEVADCLKGIVREGDVLLYENRLPDTYLELA